MSQGIWGRTSSAQRGIPSGAALQGGPRSPSLASSIGAPSRVTMCFLEDPLRSIDRSPPPPAVGVPGATGVSGLPPPDATPPPSPPDEDDEGGSPVLEPLLVRVSRTSDPASMTASPSLRRLFSLWRRSRELDWRSTRLKVLLSFRSGFAFRRRVNEAEEEPECVRAGALGWGGGDAVLGGAAGGDAPLAAAGAQACTGGSAGRLLAETREGCGGGGEREKGTRGCQLGSYIPLETVGS